MNCVKDNALSLYAMVFFLGSDDLYLQHHKDVQIINFIQLFVNT